MYEGFYFSTFSTIFVIIYLFGYSHWWIWHDISLWGLYSMFCNDSCLANPMDGGAW